MQYFGRRLACSNSPETTFAQLCKHPQKPQKHIKNSFFYIFFSVFLCISFFCSTFAAAFEKAMPNGVMVALQILVLSVWVRVLVRQL